MDLQFITERTIDLVKETGKFVADERIDFDSSKAEIKAKNDLVSYVDKESEQKLVNGLKKIFPLAGFITEENTETGRKEYNWIIDPLDGTTNYIHGIPCYCISVALAKENEILAGVVLEAARNECFYTWQDESSYLNGKKINVSKSRSISDSLIATGFPVSNFEKMESYKNALDIFMRNSHGVRRIGAAAADLCYLACGRFDGFFEFNLKPWDVAAGALIVKNAGGELADFSGSNNWLFGREIMACTPGIKDDFFAIVGGAFK